MVSSISTFLASIRGLALILIMRPQAALTAVASSDKVPSALYRLIVVLWAGGELVSSLSAEWAE